MGRFNQYIRMMLSDIRTTFFRFSLVPVFLACITVLVSLQIENTFSDHSQTINRLIFAAIAGSFFGVALEFSCERFRKLLPHRLPLQGITLLVPVLYYFFMTSDKNIEMAPMIRLLVICFALFAFYLWIPSYKNKTVFSENALAHFKAFFISALYSLVLALGFIAIYFAIDVLLVKLDNEIPGHIMNIMGTFFFPIYYLALLPDFNDTDAQMLEKRKTASLYPRFLEILVSYIALPLITLFTGVLTLYLVKIAITLKWPVGELGPMVLWYSAVGLFLFVLCGRLENRFALLYRKYFPFALIPLVSLQLYSVAVRINAFGITESRYYLVLFGIYAVVCAVLLLRTKSQKPSIISILAVFFAIVSIIPPIDAFTVSRTSQTKRIESILTENRMLSGDHITPTADIPMKDKLELTNIMGYMYRMGHTSKLRWLPSDYKYEDFQKVFGFSETYGAIDATETGITYYNASIDPALPIDIAGFAILLETNFYKYGDPSTQETVFKLGGKSYTFKTEFQQQDDVRFTVTDSSGMVQAVQTLKPQLQKLIASNIVNRGTLLAPSDLSFDAENSTLHMRIMLQTINFRQGNNKVLDEINGEAWILIAEK